MATVESSVAKKCPATATALSAAAGRAVTSGLTVAARSSASRARWASDFGTRNPTGAMTSPPATLPGASGMGSSDAARGNARNATAASSSASRTLAPW